MTKTDAILTEEQIVEIESRANAVASSGKLARQEDFIAHAYRDIPALCQTVRALREQLDQVVKERQEWLEWADNLTGNQHYLASKMRREITKTR